MKRILIATLLLALFGARAAHAKVNVVTTVKTLKLLTEAVGGNKVKVTALVGDSVDPHFVDAKPSYALTLSKADLLVHVGLDLEIGWLPALLDGARNPDIQPGASGNLDASSALASLIDVGKGTSRAEGDIHPLGNPHYWLAPDNALAVARAIADKLKALDADNADYYEARYAKFKKKLDKKKGEWAETAKPLSGVKVITYHKSWSYVTSWLGMVEIGYVEPKPGVPPDASHLASLVKDAKKQGAKLVLVEDFYPQNTAQKVADKAGMKLVALPSDANSDLTTYFDLIDYLLAHLTEAVAE